VRAYVKMLPRLAAEDMLDAATTTGLGTGSLEDAETVTRNLMDLASGEARRRAAPLTEAGAALMGIKVEKVKRSDG
jgi:hypothetical protein